MQVRMKTWSQMHNERNIIFTNVADRMGHISKLSDKELAI